MDYLLTTGTEAFETNTSSITPLAKHSSFIDKVHMLLAPKCAFSDVSQGHTSAVSTLLYIQLLLLLLFKIITYMCTLRVYTVYLNCHFLYDYINVAGL